jgi:hypothetical protein
MSSEDLAVQYTLRMNDRLIAITKALTGSCGASLECAVVECDRMEFEARSLRRLAQRMLTTQYGTPQN